MTDENKLASSPEAAGAATRTVPVEPTEEMVRCGWNAYLEDMAGGRERFAKTYRAMLAAAPAYALPTPAPTMVDGRKAAEVEVREWMGENDVVLKTRAYKALVDLFIFARNDVRFATRPTLQSLGGDAGVSEAVEPNLGDDYEPVMDINAQPGTRIRFRAGGGYEGERKAALAAGFVKNEIYTVKRCDIGRSMTQVLVDEIPGRWNSCLFADLTSTEKSDGWGALSSIRHLVADDAHACTFQSFGQYRTALLKAIDALSSAGPTGWQPLATAPEGLRVLLGPREAPVVGKVVHGDEERGSMATVVHYNGNTLVAGYRCSEWHHLPAAPKAAEKSGRSE